MSVNDIGKIKVIFKYLMVFIHMIRYSLACPPRSALSWKDCNVSRTKVDSSSWYRPQRIASLYLCQPARYYSPVAGDPSAAAAAGWLMEALDGTVRGSMPSNWGVPYPETDKTSRLVVGAAQRFGVLFAEYGKQWCVGQNLTEQEGSRAAVILPGVEDTWTSCKAYSIG